MNNASIKILKSLNEDSYEDGWKRIKETIDRRAKDLAISVVERGVDEGKSLEEILDDALDEESLESIFDRDDLVYIEEVEKAVEQAVINHYKEYSK